MNNNENLGPHKLSAEQQARISQKFRAAKALRDRKRPREIINSSDQFPQKNVDAKKIQGLAPVAGVKRLPLSEITMNTPSPVLMTNFNLTNHECSRSSNFKGLPTNKINGRYSSSIAPSPAENRIVMNSFEKINRNESLDGVLAENGTILDSLKTSVRQQEGVGSSCSKGVPTNIIESFSGGPHYEGLPLNKVESVDGSFETPVRQQECVGSSCSKGVSVNIIESFEDGLGESKKTPMEDGFMLNSYVTPVRQLGHSSLSESLVSSSILDEDFDESILEEIDALCEQKSATISSREARSSNCQIESQSGEKSSWEEKTHVDPVVLEGLLKTEAVLHSNNDQECEAEGLRNSEDSQIGSMPEDYAKYMRSLNDKQREAACSDISIPLVIVAGPGSGKTSTMVGRVLMLLSEGIGPSHILAMTFTTAAAAEMRDRIGAVAGKATAKELMISTFHSFSLQLCRSHAEKLDRTPEFLIYGQGQQRRAIIEAVRLLDSGKNMQNCDPNKLDEESNDINSPRNFKDKSKKWLKFVTQAKAGGKNAEDFHKMGDEIGAEILRHYDSILKSCNALDYHDLISCSVRLLTDFPKVIKECQDLWKAIVIDEFQDTSAMQYGLLRILASHKRITVVGDEDQSIFSFNGADVSGFNSFRKDFPMHKEIRLNKNYRSTRCIIEAAASLIRNNLKRCQSKNVLTDNSSGSKITIKECCSEDAQCAFVVDKILEITSNGSSVKGSFGDIAVLYRRQVSGKMFQTAFRDRKIPFNIHGVAFYRKKAVRAIIALLRTTLPACDDGSFRRVFKALLPYEKEEKKRMIEHIDKISTVRRCSYISAACDIFSAKISGTFKRSQLTQGRKVLLTLDIISKLVHREQSVSAVITSVANMIPQVGLTSHLAILSGKQSPFINWDTSICSVRDWLCCDNTITISLAPESITHVLFKTETKCKASFHQSGIGLVNARCLNNERVRSPNGKCIVELGTFLQLHGLNCDIFLIFKFFHEEIFFAWCDSLSPILLLYVALILGSVIQEERRLLYVAMTRAKKKLFILHVLMDSNWQMLQPSRFLKEIPKHLQEIQDESGVRGLQTNQREKPKGTSHITDVLERETESSKAGMVFKNSAHIPLDDESKELTETIEGCNGNTFLRRFTTDQRAVVSHLFHQWAKKAAFQDPKRLLDKVSFVIDERLRVKKSTHKDVLCELKTILKSEEAFQYAEHVLKWEQIPADKRAYIMREKQEHFQKLRIEKAMGSSAPTCKQVPNILSWNRSVFGIAFFVVNEGCC
ncbi:hypothetical protein LguiA_034712 [Lonicera macranthoides]